MNIFNLIIAFLAFSFTLSFLYFLIYGKITEKKFSSIADKFQKRFGYMPFPMIVGKSGGVIFWSYKESYLICSLFLPKMPGTKKTLTQEEIAFFRNLDKNEISWFYRKYLAFAVAMVSLIATLILLKLKDSGLLLNAFTL
ncbi:hypothetical protein [Pantoea vagans]|uniref:hypothetical protein n=1 Tax=Pantoea vagans TaxID=470934 RepID=UPI0028E624FB|nr:hypothetical protein [Pantoea vagans]